MKKIQHILTTLFVFLIVASCTQDMDIESNQGYLSLDINTLVTTNKQNGTRRAIPEDYDAKTLHVEIKDKNGDVVKSTDNFGTDETFQGKILLTSGSYTIVAHSANWDGNASGFNTPYYYGETTVQVVPKSLVTAELICTQANVKITVNYDQSIVNNFKTAKTTVSSSLANVAPLVFEMNKTTQSGFIPVGDFEAVLEVKNKKDQKYESDPQAFTGVKPRDHYILNYKLQEVGDLGDGNGPGVKVEVDESTNTYTYTIEVARKSAITLVTRAANAWSNFAILNASVTGKTTAFKSEGLSILWKKKTESDWKQINNAALTIDATDNVQTTLKGLVPETAYEYRLQYVDGDNVVVCDPVTFTTEKQEALYNGGFEYWNLNGDVWMPNESGKDFWDSSNAGSAGMMGKDYNVTTQATEDGKTCAKLETKFVFVKLAAASIFTGKFGEMNDDYSGATLNWGVPFGNRPTSLKGFYKYAPASINKGTRPSGAPEKGNPDVCQIYCALTTTAIQVDNSNMSTFPNWQQDERVVAYGTLPDDKCGKTNGWEEFNIPLEYHSLTTKPTHLIIVCSSSRYGDYFYGGEGSTLYLDDFELVYGDNPVVR